MLDVCLAELLGRLDTPAGEHLIGIVIVLVLSASMSTLSSLVLTSSSTLTLDLLQGNVVKKMSEQSKLGWMRVLIVVFIIVSAALALVQYNSSITFIAQLICMTTLHLDHIDLIVQECDFLCDRIDIIHRALNF